MKCLMRVTMIVAWLNDLRTGHAGSASRGRRNMRRFSPRFVVASVLGFAALSLSAADKPKADGPISYDKQVRPILQARCHGCHQPAKAKGKYVMTTFEQLLAGGESGDKAVVAKHVAKSFLINQITPKDGKADMPPKKKPLKTKEIELISKWINQGAIDDTPVSARKKYNAKNPPTYSTPPVIAAVDFSPDGKSLVSGSDDLKIKLWDIEKSKLLTTLDGHDSLISSIAYIDDKSFISVGLDGIVKIWDVTKRMTVKTLKLNDPIFNLQLSSDRKSAYLGCKAGNIIYSSLKD